jgi:integrase
MSDTHPTAPTPTVKPAKPYPDFPLFPHAAGVWAKKIRGKLHYFGPWADPDAALAKYLEQKDALHAGKKPRPEAGSATVKDVVNAFLNHKKALLDAGELSPHTWAKYKTAADLVIAQLGKARLAADLDPQDFAALRKRMAAQWGVYRLGDMIQHVRSIFKHGHDAGLLPLPVCFGPGFARPTKKAQRLHRAAQGPKLFTAAEVREMIGAATVPVRAMILLGINCGFGNADCGNLPSSAVDLDNAVIDYPRPKTGIARRCPLWPETVDAIRAVLAKRPNPKNEEGAALVFLTRCGASWARDNYTSPLVLEMRKLLRRLSINGRKRLGFYTLRHTFRTVADEAKDQPAVDFIMGHEVPHMSAVYRETIGDDRLRAVAEHVRAWLFGGPAAAPSPPAGGGAGQPEQPGHPGEPAAAV